MRARLAWLALWLSRARGLVVPGALGCVFTDWRQLPTTTDALQAAGWVWRGIVPWDKTERGRPQQGRYRAQAEYIAWGTDGARPLQGPTAPGVLRLPIPRQKHHIAGKPLGLMEGLMIPMEAGPILDPFMGSGTVGLACQAQGRPYVGIEVDATYFEIACRRLQEGLNGASSEAATG
ncbi:DNA methyltransferase [Xanthobacter aminoxidans]|uniref:DNA-methyltransferase n=1 Tax=Xanthobacter aminoxidans TaxID=186280 RepID=UPI003727B445